MLLRLSSVPPIQMILLSSTEGDFLPAIQLLLPEHPAVRTAAGDAGGHAPVPTSVPVAPRTQAAARRIPAQTSATDHQVPTVTEGWYSTVAVHHAR